MAQPVDMLIVNAHLFTMQGSGVGYVPQGGLAVSGSRIAAVGPAAELVARYAAAETIDATDCAVLPGLIDAHMHTPWAVVRGVAQDVAQLDAKGAGALCPPSDPRGNAGWHPTQRPGGAQGWHHHLCAIMPSISWLGHVLSTGGRSRPADADDQRPASRRDGGLEGGRPLPARSGRWAGRDRPGGCICRASGTERRTAGSPSCWDRRRPDMLSLEHLLAGQADRRARWVDDPHARRSGGPRDRSDGQAVRRAHPGVSGRGSATWTQQLLAVHLTEATDRGGRADRPLRGAHGSLLGQHRPHRRHCAASAALSRGRRAGGAGL